MEKILGEYDLRSRCRVVSNLEGDTFVGIKSEMDDNMISICFPMGYRIPDDVELLRQDTKNLIDVLERFSIKKEQHIPAELMMRPETIDFPLDAYFEVLRYYYVKGYYSENEVTHIVAKRGKVDWSRTIKKQRPFLQDDSPIYLDLVVKDTIINDDTIISQIHKCCVFEGYEKIGWLFTDTRPNHSTLSINKNTRDSFTAILKAKMFRTNDDLDKKLFSSMIQMINYLAEQDNPKSFYFGTERFEYVWEKLIDYTFGIDINGKYNYFPKSKWILTAGKRKENRALEPDTIMTLGDRVFVIDAKYYKYGITGIPDHLPASSSINKQITYAEYVEQNAANILDLKNKGIVNPKIFNAFIMPFDHKKEPFVSNDNFMHIGYAEVDWKGNTKTYEKVQGILVDVSYLMKVYCSQRNTQVTRLAAVIETACSYRPSPTNMEVSEELVPLMEIGEVE